MGCGSSQPEAVVQKPHMAAAARTETAGVWDDDFKLPSQKKSAPKAAAPNPPGMPMTPGQEQQFFQQGLSSQNISSRSRDASRSPPHNPLSRGNSSNSARPYTPNPAIIDDMFEPPIPPTYARDITIGTTRSQGTTHSPVRSQHKQPTAGQTPAAVPLDRGVSGGSRAVPHATPPMETRRVARETSQRQRSRRGGSSRSPPRDASSRKQQVPIRSTSDGSNSVPPHMPGNGTIPGNAHPYQPPANYDSPQTARQAPANFAQHTLPLRQRDYRPSPIPEEGENNGNERYRREIEQNIQPQNQGQPFVDQSGLPVEIHTPSQSRRVHHDEVSEISMHQWTANGSQPRGAPTGDRKANPPMEIQTRPRSKAKGGMEQKQESHPNSTPRRDLKPPPPVPEIAPSVHRDDEHSRRTRQRDQPRPKVVVEGLPGNNGVPRPPRPPPSNPVSITARSFEDYYIPGMDLGQGAFAKVFVGIEKATNMEYAVKNIYDRKKMRWNGRDALMDEIGNLEKLRKAPNIVYLHDHFVTETQCYMVLELLPGKELFERLIQKGVFTEVEARDSCRCVLNALSYMHDRRMTHRDLKPENLLLVDELDIDQVKLTDFGFSKTMTKRNECRTLCGTPGYLAPEILERWPAYDTQCDMFSFGSILFLLLGGYLPFDSHGKTDVKQVFERTRNGQYHFYPQRWENISPTAKDLVAKCLSVNPHKRISAKEALMHDWMGEGLALPKTQISAQSFAGVFENVKREREKKQRDRDLINQIDRLQELNDDFTIFLEKRQDSLMSAITGPGRTVHGNVTVSTFTTQFREDSNTGKPFSTFYKKGKFLGKGGFATVHRYRHKNSGIQYAVKEVETSEMGERETNALKEEITVLKYLRGAPFILRLFDVFYEKGTTYMVLEEMQGGDVLQRICEKEVYTEREARDLCKVLFRAINYCHKKKIAHRDIKLENLLLQHKDDDSSIKLADFGFAKKLKQKNGSVKLLSTMCGTPHYMAPEVLNLRVDGYDFRCDMWSVGVVVYCLLGGYLPFEGSLKDLADSVIRGDYRFHEEYWGSVSPSAKRLIYSLLRTDPATRLTASQALESRWIEMDDAELSVKDLSLTKSKMDNMRKISSGKQKVQNAVRAIIGANKFSDAAAISTILRKETILQEESDNDSEDLDFEVHFEDVYEMGEVIGDGLFSKYHLATNLLAKQVYTAKKVARCELHPRDVAALDDEIATLRDLADGSGCKHVIYLHEVYEDPDATFLVFGKIQGDVLIEHLIQRKKYTEFDAKELTRNLLMGVKYCHEKQIAIRNMTLDNLILPPGSETDVIIADFEFSKKVRQKNGLRTQCGTQEFVAPEVLENRPAYDVSCDMWTVGVILFILLGGYYPFRGKTDTEILKNVRYGNFEFRERFWEGISGDAQALVQDLLTVNPEERITAKDALETCAWIQATPTTLSKDLTVTVEEMRRELGLKFKAAVQTIRAAQLLQYQL